MEPVIRSRVVILSVKPHILPGAVTEVAKHITKEHLVISIAAGITLDTLQEVGSIDDCTWYLQDARHIILEM